MISLSWFGIAYLVFLIIIMLVATYHSFKIDLGVDYNRVLGVALIGVLIEVLIQQFYK